MALGLDMILESRVTPSTTPNNAVPTGEAVVTPVSGVTPIDLNPVEDIGGGPSMPPGVPLPSAGDADDQFSEARSVGSPGLTNSLTSVLEIAGDVDMFKIDVDGQRFLYFDVDTTLVNNRRPDPYLRLFNSLGIQLAHSDNHSAPGETDAGPDSYFSYRFAAAGTYYVAISDTFNRGYSPIAGTGDVIDSRAVPGNFSLTVGDADANDTFAEAKSLGNITRAKKQDERLDEFDVDVWSFKVEENQKLAFDLDFLRSLDEVGASLRANVRILSGAGKLLASGFANQAPREVLSDDPYIEYLFTKAGTYYLVVSSIGNVSSDLVSGEKDVKGVQTGNYSLEITSLFRQSKSKSASRITGIVDIPNRNEHRKDPISPFLERVGENGNAFGPILGGNKTTWIVIHGRADSSASFRKLGGLLDRYKKTDQVLILDWNQGASDNRSIIGDAGLQGSEWIHQVADWAAFELKKRGIKGENINLVGHSWGTYAAYQIGKRYLETSPASRVNSIVALDPARHGDGFGIMGSDVNFSAVAKLSWAFFGDGLFGNEFLSASANEAFVLKYTKNMLLEPGATHSAPVRLFESLVAAAINTSKPNQTVLHFSLDRLEKASISKRWVNNKFANSGIVIPADAVTKTSKLKVFEGQFTLN